MVVYATPNLPVAGVVSGLFFGIWNLFTGFLIGHQVRLTVCESLSSPTINLQEAFDHDALQQAPEFLSG